MDSKVLQKILNRYSQAHNKVLNDSMVAEKYYNVKNDILDYKRDKTESEEAVRQADNRIPSSFYKLLVNQKASYLLGIPPVFDTGSKSTNKRLLEILGSRFNKTCKDICVNACNCTYGVIHVWIDDNNELKYAVVDSKQIMPIYNDNLDKELIAVVRQYLDLDEDTGDTYYIYEYWDKQYCYSYKQKSNGNIEPYYRFPLGLNKFTNKIKHNFGTPPFIIFNNNNTNTTDLADIKSIIDSYDITYSGFLNDLQDTEEVILVLENYGGEDLKGFLENIKKYKAVNIETDDDSKGGLSTLTIDIPVEARTTILNASRKAIFEQGCGVDPAPESFGNTSGEALKFMYGLLELKASITETEFRLSFERFIKMICDYYKLQYKTIEQTWTRNCIKNNAELINMASQSKDIVSQKTILKNHPWVENADKEIEQLTKEKEENMERFNNGLGANDYNNNNSNNNNNKGKEEDNNNNAIIKQAQTNIEVKEEKKIDKKDETE